MWNELLAMLTDDYSKKSPARMLRMLAALAKQDLPQNWSVKTETDGYSLYFGEYDVVRVARRENRSIIL